MSVGGSVCVCVSVGGSVRGSMRVLAWVWALGAGLRPPCTPFGKAFPRKFDVLDKLLDALFGEGRWPGCCKGIWLEVC